MFGMEHGRQEKGGVADYVFDLEADLKNPAKLRALKEQVEERIHQLKALLRSGEDKQTFDRTQTLLHGYLAVQRVIQRVNRKMF